MTIEDKQKEFLVLFEPVQKKLSNYCRMMCGYTIYAEDLLNDTILAAYEGIERLEDTKCLLLYN